jgi:hypothetical protein
LKIITDVLGNLGFLEKAIGKFGHNVEHHLHHYLAIGSPKRELIFFSLPGGKGVLASRESDVWYVFAEGVLAPEKERAALLGKVLSHALAKGKAKRVVLELEEDSRKEALAWIKASKRFRAVPTNYVLSWPVFDMDLFDPKLPGRRWKKMRNIRNRFTKQHDIKIVDSKTLSKETLDGIVTDWLRKRTHGDTVKKEYYYNVIASNFKGMQVAKTVVVDGKPCTITAGWDVPNGKKHYYSGVGILNYRHKGLGEFANLMDLIFLKKKGYKLVDFGGSDPSLLTFKNKFRPHRIYKTYCFSVMRKKG